MFEGVNDRFFFLLWRLRRSAILTLRKIVILPFYDPAFPFRFRNIQVCHMETVLFLNPLLNLFVGSLTLGGSQIQLIHIHLNADMMLRFREFGQCTYSLIEGNNARAND